MWCGVKFANLGATVKCRIRQSTFISNLSLVTLSIVLIQPGTAAVASTTASCATIPTCVSIAATTGLPDAEEPSGMAPPPTYALSGYQQTYVTDFGGSSLPEGWATYSGQPGNDPGTEWRPSQVVVSNGTLQLNVSNEPSTNEWISGGTSGGPTATYGAYFVRSRLTAPGPTIVELLWPSENVWPPEIDFNETYGPTTGSMATVHYTSANKVDHRKVTVDMTQWHTWGVVWTPKSITYTVDGKVWGIVMATSEIPNIPMHLAIQQQTWCSKGFACPTAPASAIIDWVAEYSPGSAAVISGGQAIQHMAIDTSLSTATLVTLIRHLAQRIVKNHAASIELNVLSTASLRTNRTNLSGKVKRVISLLQSDISIDGAKPLRVSVHWLSPTSGKGVVDPSILNLTFD